MTSDFQDRVRTVDWHSFETAYGPADNVGDWLIVLASSDEKAAMAASHDLWCSLCHQHVFISSAAEPALPFLLEVFESAGTQLRIEILDILSGLAACSIPPGSARPHGGVWVERVRSRLHIELPRFQTLASDPNEEISGFANSIVKSLKRERFDEAVVWPANSPPRPGA